MGNYRNNGPSFSGMRTFRMFYRTKREPRTWLDESKSELRPEDRTVVSHRLLKLRATLKAKKQAKEIRDARIRRLMQGERAEHARKKQAKQIRDARINHLMRDVRSDIERKKKREARTVLAAKKAVLTAKRVTLRKERARNRRSQAIREIQHRARLREERKQRHLEKTLRQAEKARRKAEKKEVERVRVQTALAKQATQDRVKARKLRLNRLLKEIRRKRRG